jgi:hypothetical protein
MVDVDGAAHVSKAMPVNVELAAKADVAAVKETGCVDGVVDGVVDGLVDGLVYGVVDGAVVAGVDEPDDATAEVRTRSIDELSAPHVAVRSTA